MYEYSYIIIYPGQRNPTGHGNILSTTGFRHIEAKKLLYIYDAFEIYANNEDTVFDLGV
jgi:hypothetical protein